MLYWDIYFMKNKLLLFYVYLQFYISSQMWNSHLNDAL